jgi:hypothetical protein
MINLEAIVWKYGEEVRVTVVDDVIVSTSGVPPLSEEQLLDIDKEYQIYKEQESIDDIAYSKIIKVASEWTQRNMLARSSEFLEKMHMGEELTPEEEAEREYIRSIWDRVKALRTHAKYLKSEVEAGNNPDINTGWSE